MTAPSNANTSGLDYFGYRVFNAGVGACWLVAKPGPNDTHPEPLVTAASAQARIDAAEARADRLARFGQHTNWELSFCYLDDDDEDGCWTVHSVNGGNDREWTVIGRGEAPDDAIRAALQQETQK